jgi:hypothetical protein
MAVGSDGGSDGGGGSGGGSGSGSGSGSDWARVGSAENGGEDYDQTWLHT